MEKAMKTEPKMMPGTESAASYFAFAKKGNVLLGIKPYGMMKGEVFGVAGTTYFTGRLRSAPAGSLFDDEKGKKVVKLEANPENLWDAWPGVEWEKKNLERASTTIGVFMRGQFSKDTEVMKVLLDAISDRKMSDKTATYLIELAGPKSVFVTHRELSSWLDKHYDEITKRILLKIEHSKEASAELEKNIGVFGMQAQVLKKIHEKFAKAEEQHDAASQGGQEPDGADNAGNDGHDD
jgi:hypothetical protein